MIPILFPPDEKDFTTNGLGRLTDCRVFEVTEERNGIYEAYFEYPVEGELYPLLRYGYYVFATHDESKTPQAFEIYNKETSLDGWAKYRAWHISYQLNDIILRPFTANSCADVMSKIADNAITGCPFTFTTNKAVSADFVLDIPKAARAVLGGTSGSVLDVYGKGDYEFDMFNVKLFTDRGADRGVSIRYGKNLTKLDQTLEGGNIVNGVVPYWQSTDGEVVALDKVIYSNAISYDIPLETHTLEVLQTHVPEDIYAQYVNLKVQTLDLSSEFESAPTLAELQTKAEQLLTSSNAYEIQDNIKVDFVALWQTEEYKNFAALERVFLCDTVHIFYEKLGVNAKAKCIKVVYDTLRERYSSIELGEPQTTFGQQITNVVTENVVGEVRGLIKGLPDKSFLQSAIDYATQMIEGGLGGYVVIEPDESGHPEEILIMDTPDKATAVNVWRWNSGGLGHSSTGYNGPYNDIALTADGKINASMITTGVLNADIIKAGTIQDSSGENYWNLDTGQFVTKQGEIADFIIDQTSLRSGTVGQGTDGTAITDGTWESTKTGTISGSGYTYQYTVKTKISNGGLEMYSSRDDVDPDLVQVLKIEPHVWYVNGTARHNVYFSTSAADGYLFSINKSTEVDASAYPFNVHKRTEFLEAVKIDKDVQIGTDLTNADLEVNGNLVVDGTGVAFGKSTVTSNIVDSAWSIKAPNLLEFH